MERKSGIGECRGGGRGRRGELLGVESGQKRKAVVAGEGKQREEGMDLSRRHTRTGAAKQASFSGWGRRFHAATVTRSGGERSWIWAAVSLSTTDRKSTRLNSSHLVISYAVFCLKKKKNYRTWFTRNHGKHWYYMSH